MLKDFADIVHMNLLSFALLFVIGFCQAADNTVNRQMQETQKQMDEAKTKNLPSYQGTNQNVLPEAPPTITPIGDIEPLNSNEQFPIPDRPRGAYVKPVDPSNSLQEELKEKQERQRYRKNYEKALKKQIDNRRQN